MAIEQDCRTTVVFETASSPEDRKQAIELIYSVFMGELGYEEIRPDAYDDAATYVVGRNRHGIIAAVRIILDGPDGLPLDGYSDLSPMRRASACLAEVSRLACHPDHRKNLVALRGIGRVRSTAHELGASHIVIDSLLNLVPLYCRLGFEPFGDPFIDSSVSRTADDMEPNAQVMWASLDGARG